MSALKQIKQRIAALPDNTTELDLSKIKIGTFDQQTKKILEKYRKIQILILSNCELQSLDNLPQWKLTAVELSQNKLTDSALIRLSTYTSLTQIICVSNKIESLDSLKPLSNLKKLQEVDFTDNPVSLLANYRTILFDSYLQGDYSIKSLQTVDQKDVNGNQVGEQEQFDDDDQEQQYGDEDDDFEGDEQDDDYEQEESSQKPKKKRK